MGLGKTLQSISLLAYLKSISLLAYLKVRYLVITPSHGSRAWVRPCRASPYSPTSRRLPHGMLAVVEQGHRKYSHSKYFEAVGRYYTAIGSEPEQAQPTTYPTAHCPLLTTSRRS
eukprot:scaffold126225_cov27-Phaeocystis_antarctica.AAC.1